MKDDLHDLMDKVFLPKPPTDIVKGVAYYQGEVSVGAQTKHKTLITMVVLSDQPTATQDKQEVIFMGAVNGLTDKINALKKFKPPYRMGRIDKAILNVSNMTPDDLKED